MNVGFIGAGKVGNTLGKYFEQNDIALTGYFDIDKNAAMEAADFTLSTVYTSLSELVKCSDIIFITTTDNIIQYVWEDIKELPIEGKIICHCSGALSSAVFKEVDEKGAFGYSIHPLFSCSSKTSSYKKLYDALITIEGSKEHLQEVEELFKRIGNSTRIIDSTQKIKYHAAAVFASNQPLALAGQGADILEQCGFTRDEAIKAVLFLMSHAIENIEKQGLEEALTGPVERNDIITVKKHLKALSEEEKNIYISLSRKLIKIAKIKNPEKNYIELEELLGQN
ncbi:protein of unknown function DUF2520 [Ruminiclostridium papyrosolvens DSM 2782]|uniref:DUF2520 domain-containing protein n=1 Tax=Ruminiclostridium papyrosolvens DSM 2782 TaxID=588581 RepID=F1T9U3_9FIRM|nr:Rossmann-like and DUF2520 domain-containing protein [Ruminiclostridium papyrosolvens]EGD48685.1 protein of unknown function DUF2520 [Ruminiclostridium papyrosolvens DSM 2782]WES32558.1 DUF2520 domain-containing protein [Ruminiclostridium papyrosolvens DSM 2782]